MPILPQYHNDYRPGPTRAQQREFLGRVGYNVGKAVWSDVKRIGKAYGVPIMVGGVRQAAGAAAGNMITPDRKKGFGAPGAPKKQKTSHNYSKKKSMPDAEATADISTQTVAFKRRKLEQIVQTDETNQCLRLPACNYRLHAPKAMSLPGILNELFIPKLTSRLSFGFTSNTGISQSYDVSGSDNSTTGTAGAAPRGCYRGVSLLKFRFTDKNVNRTEANALNATHIARNQAVGGKQILSHMRQFLSSPTLANVGGGSKVTQPAIQTITDDPVLDNSKIRQLGAGANLTHFEDHAYQAPAFMQAVGSGINTEQIGTMDTEDVADWDGQVPVLQGSGSPESPYYYPNNAKEATMRIIDGFVEFDISNSSKTSAVIEVVLHSMKKTSVDINSPEVYKSLFNNYEYYSKSQYQENAPDVNGSDTGGWQTFYDPKVPLLSCPKKFNKNLHAYEVHRSNHVLGVGQSKKIKISLGSLTYKLGNKSDSILSNEADDLKTYTKRDNAGTILVAIGHTGFDALESVAVPGQTLTSAVLGQGLWAGKSPSPSSIVVSGMYQEQYYPMYMATSGRLIGNHGVPRPSFITDGPGNYNLPQNKIVATTVASVSADEVGAPIGNQAATKN